MQRSMSLLLLVLVATTARAATLSGVVVDADGKPVANAHVSVYTAAPRIGVSALCPSCYRDCGKSQAVDANGAFRLDGLDPALVFDLLAVAPGYEGNLVRAVDPAFGAVTIRLTPRPRTDRDRLIIGRVLDPDGKPVIGAKVEHRGYRVGNRTGFGNIAGIDRLSITDRQGEFALRIPDPAARLDVLVTAKNFAPHIERMLAPGELRAMRLAEGATVTGRVMQDGRPVAGARVAFVQRNRESSQYLGRSEIGTNEEGWFVQTNLAPEETYVVFVPMETTPRTARLTMVTTPRRGESVDAGELVLDRGRRIAGCVTVPPGAALPEKAQILLTWPLADDWRRSELHEDGSFAFETAPSEAVRLSVRLPRLKLSRASDGYPLDGVADVPAGGDVSGVQLVFERP